MGNTFTSSLESALYHWPNAKSNSPGLAKEPTPLANANPTPPLLAPALLAPALLAPALLQLVLLQSLFSSIIISFHIQNEIL
jgi:hypothetical protein